MYIHINCNRIMKAIQLETRDLSSETILLTNDILMHEDVCTRVYTRTYTLEYIIDTFMIHWIYHYLYTFLE